MNCWKSIPDQFLLRVADDLRKARIAAQKSPVKGGMNNADRSLLEGQAITLLAVLQLTLDLLAARDVAAVDGNPSGLAIHQYGMHGDLIDAAVQQSMFSTVGALRQGALIKSAATPRRAPAAAIRRVHPYFGNCHAKAGLNVTLEVLVEDNHAVVQVH